MAKKVTRAQRIVKLQAVKKWTHQCVKCGAKFTKPQEYCMACLSDVVPISEVSTHSST